MRRHVPRLIALVCAAAAAPSIASAQLARLVPDVVTTAAETPGSRTVQGDSVHFVPDLDASGVRALSAAMGAQFASYPLDRSWSGFTVTTDANGVARIRPGDFLGTAGLERATTAGRRTFTVGFSQQTSRFDMLDGIDLAKGDLTMVVQHDVPEGPETQEMKTFRYDVLEERLAFKTERTAYSFFGNIGLSDRVDLAVGIPIVKVNAQARVASRILRLGSAGDPTIHAFDLVPGDPPASVQIANKATYASGAAQGLGDIQVQAKVNLLRTDTQALAAAVAVRFPTGSESDWLGSGVLQTEARVLWSGTMGRVGPHVSGGYTFASGGATFDDGTGHSTDIDVPNELNLRAGAEVIIASRLSVGADLQLRRLFDVTRFGLGSASYPSPTVPAAFTATNLLLPGGTSGITQASVVTGARFLVSDRWVLSGDVLLPVTDNGLTPKVSLVAGINYLF